MAKKILVSNIDPITSEEDIFSLFEEFGEVESAVIRDEPDPDKDTFTAEVEMPFEDEAENAIAELDGEQIDGQWLYVRFVEQDKGLKKEKILIDEEDEIGSGGNFEVIQKKKRLKG